MTVQSTPTLRIGIDLDNTIVCYDRVFYEIGVERGLIAQSDHYSRLALRELLRKSGRETIWTEIQGEAYGPGMAKAHCFPGVRGFFESCATAGASVCIVSHRTRFPYAGPRYDLRAAANVWLRQNGLLRSDRNTARSAPQVFFEESVEDKLGRIRTLQCTHFVDDLPALLGHPQFPERTMGILFSPSSELVPGQHGTPQFHSWAEIGHYVLERGGDANVG